MDEELRTTLIARLQRARTPEERYMFELRVLHYDMEQARVWNNQLAREFSLRGNEIELAYIESQVSKSRWT